MQQVERLLVAAQGNRFEALVALAVATGLRWGEVSALRWADIGGLSLYETYSIVMGCRDSLGAPVPARNGLILNVKRCPGAPAWASRRSSSPRTASQEAAENERDT
jgi:hypothetical protein